MHLIYKQLRLYINLYILKQQVFLQHNDDYNQMEFDLKSVSEEFILFHKSLDKQSIQYFII